MHPDASQSCQELCQVLVSFFSVTLFKTLLQVATEAGYGKVSNNFLQSDNSPWESALQMLILLVLFGLLQINLGYSQCDLCPALFFVQASYYIQRNFDSSRQFHYL